MMSIKLLWLTQLCILPILVQPYPHATLEMLIKEYSEGITQLKRIARELEHAESADDLTKFTESQVVEEPEEYDFIVIGGGTSGSVIANRLSEVPEWTVLVLESGGEESKIGEIPAVAEMIQLSAYNWGYKMEPQQHACLGMVNHQCSLTNGRGLGGTSSINAMLYTRGNTLDYDRWADEDLKSWCYNDVLPYFKKSEDVALDKFDHKFHNKGGPLPVEHVQYHSPLAETFLEAAHELEQPTIDFNGKQQLGFGYTQSMTRHGKRRSTSGAFLEPASSRKNLIISPQSHVTDIIIGDHTHEAKGVKYIKGGKLHVAKARKEVILAAGLYNSPQLLMLSGVGPKNQLEKHGIPVKVELEGVGQSLQDHNTFLGLNFLVNETELLKQPSLEENLKYWLTEGKGPLTKTQDIEALGYIKTKASKDDKDYPDMELQFISRPFDKEYGEIFKRSVNMDDDTYKHVFEPLQGHYVWSIFPTLLHPKSVGKVELKSKNPAHWPKVIGKHFSDPDDHDMETMIQGIVTALSISKTAPFKRWSTKLAEVTIPGCDKFELHSREYWACAVRKLTIPNSQAGTCKMGPKSDKLAVVDENLKVYGVDKLRVADNSIFPNALSAHSTAPTIMVGEKAADLIKEAWK